MIPELIQPKKKVAIVDDHAIFRHGLRNLILELPDYEIAFEAENGLEAIHKLEAQKADIILMDIEMPVMDGINSTILIKQKFPCTRILVLSMHCQEALVNDLKQRGASGYLSKNVEFDILVQAMKSVYVGEDFFDPKRSEDRLKELAVIKPKEIFTKPVLSEREIAVAKLMCQEYTNREMADILCISVRTLETYRQNVLAKTRSKNIVGVVYYVLKHGLI